MERDKVQFLTKWILVTSGACVLGLFVAFVVAHICQPFLWGGKETNLVVAPCIAAVVGCAQWLLLRKEAAVSGWWVLACAIGVGTPFVIGEILCRVGFLPSFLPDPQGIVGFLCYAGIGVSSGHLDPNQIADDVQGLETVLVS